MPISNYSFKRSDWLVCDANSPLLIFKLARQRVHTVSHQQIHRLGYRTILPGLLYCLLLISAGASAQKASFAEEQIQAVFLFHFANFIKWPTVAFAADDSTFNICATEHTALSAALEATIAGETTVDGHAMRLFSPVSAEDLSSCHIVYLPSGYDSDLLVHIQNSGVVSVLTVSDEANFISRGGMIELDYRKGRVRSTINTTALDKAGLKASAKLLQLSTVVSQ